MAQMLICDSVPRAKGEMVEFGPSFDPVASLVALLNNVKCSLMYEI